MAMFDLTWRHVQRQTACFGRSAAKSPAPSTRRQRTIHAGPSRDGRLFPLQLVVSRGSGISASTARLTAARSCGAAAHTNATHEVIAGILDLPPADGSGRPRREASSTRETLYRLCGARKARTQRAHKLSPEPSQRRYITCRRCWVTRTSTRRRPTLTRRLDDVRCKPVANENDSALGNEDSRSER